MGLVLLGGCEPPPTDTPTVPAANVDAALSAAQHYLDTGAFEKGAAILSRLVERVPDDVRGHEMLGRTLLAQSTQAEQSTAVAEARRLRREARDAYETAVRLDPDHAPLRHAAGVVAMMDADAAAALAHFEQAVALDPDAPQYRLFAAQVLIQQSRHDAARTHLDTVLALAPDEPVALASLAVIDAETGNVEAARTRIAAARRLAPDDLGLRAQEARIWRRTGDARSAVERLAGLPASDRADPAVTAEIAAAYAALDAPDRAAAAWMHRLEHGPRGARWPEDAVRAARAWHEAGELARARRCLRLAAPHLDATTLATLETELLEGR